MYEARVIRDFTFRAKFPGRIFKKGDIIGNLTKQDVDYLSGNNRYHGTFIDNVREIVEEAVKSEEVETATKKTTTRKANSKKK